MLLTAKRAQSSAVYGTRCFNVAMRMVFACLLLVAAICSAATAAEGPALRLVRIAPLTVAGNGFARNETIRLVVAVRGQRDVHSLRANASGSFTRRIATLVALDPCRGTISVTAVGAASRRTATSLRGCRPPHTLP